MHSCVPTNSAMTPANSIRKTTPQASWTKVSLDQGSITGALQKSEHVTAHIGGAYALRRLEHHRTVVFCKWQGATSGDKTKQMGPATKIPNCPTTATITSECDRLCASHFNSRGTRACNIIAIQSGMQHTILRLNHMCGNTHMRML